MEKVKKKTMELINGWKQNKIVWRSIGISSYFIYLATFVFTFTKVLSAVQKDKLDIEQLLVYLLWFGCMMSIALLRNFEVNCNEKPSARSDRAQSLSEDVTEQTVLDKISVIQFTQYDIMRFSTVTVLLTYSTILYYFNVLKGSDLILFICVIAIFITCQSVRKYAWRNYYTIQDENGIEKLDRLIQKEWKNINEEQNYWGRRAKTMLNKTDILRLYEKINVEKEKDSFKLEIEDMEKEWTKMENDNSSIRTSAGFNWYGMGIVAYVLVASLIAFMLWKPIIEIIERKADTPPEYPHSVHLWIMSFFLLFYSFSGANESLNIYRKCENLYETVMVGGVLFGFGPFGPSAKKDSNCALEKNIIASLACMIMGCIFFSNSLISIEELRIFISNCILFVALYYFGCFCFTRFVRLVVDVENNKLVKVYVAKNEIYKRTVEDSNNTTLLKRSY